MNDLKDFKGGVSVVSGTSSVIVGPVNLALYPEKTVQLYNLDSVTLSGAVVQVSNDPGGNERGNDANNKAMVGPGMWADYDTATFTNIGSGQSRATTLPGAYRWWRVVGVNNFGGSTTVLVSGFGFGASK